MSVRDIGRFWERWEPGWKIILAIVAILTAGVTTVSYALDIKVKADKVPVLEAGIAGLQRDVIEMKNDVKWIVQDMRKK